ncbi:hypothetical protein [Aeoliella sp.]|uniref:hypothetical protein n=1 Tax=Aeoliella sp. TaxID=2795800 RepID=UPI003CCC3DD5
MLKKLRISLRTWFVLFTLVAIGCYWYLGGAIRQKKAVQRVHALAGQGLDPDEWARFSSPAIEFKSFNAENPPQTLGEWFQHQLCQQIGYEYFGTIESVNLSDSPLEPGDLAMLRHLRGVESLNLTGCEITDDALVHVAQCESLTKLFVGYTPITDEGIKHLRSLPNLQELSVTGTAVTDKSISHLQDMPSLRTVDTGSTGVSYAGRRALNNAVPPILVKRIYGR